MGDITHFFCPDENLLLKVRGYGDRIITILSDDTDLGNILDEASSQSDMLDAFYSTLYGCYLVTQMNQLRFVILPKKEASPVIRILLLTNKNLALYFQYAHLQVMFYCR